MHLLDLLFPKVCLGCGKFGSYICPRCSSGIRIIEPSKGKCPVCEKPAIDGITHPHCRTKYSIDGLTSFFRYDGVIKTAIKQIKYRYAFDIVKDLIHRIPDSSFDFFPLLRIKNYEPRRRQGFGGQVGTMYLLPIPLHPSRYRDRGFNQAEIIAQALGKRMQIPVHTDVLIRIKKTVPQVAMKDREKRLANMKNVFAIKDDSTMLRCNDITILLVDDVFTTGATLRSAASVLKHAGVKAVWGITIAQ
jgi:ComF family protein